MTPRELQTLILTGPKAALCAPHVHTNEMPKIDGAAAFAKDKAIADILSDGRTRVASRMISERGVRGALPVIEAASFLRDLRALSEAQAAPEWLAPVLDGLGIAQEEHWAYFDTLQSGWYWLQDAQGLDLGEGKTQDLLSMLAVGPPDVHVKAAAAKLKAHARVDDPITAAEVSNALRGPWGDE